MKIHARLVETGIVARAIQGDLPAAWPGESREEATRRLGCQPWSTSKMILHPGEICRGWCEEMRCVVTRIGAVMGRGYPHALYLWGEETVWVTLIVPDLDRPAS